MKRVSFIAATFVFVLLGVMPLFAQTAGPKIAIIYSDAFFDEKEGIKKLLTAYTGLSKEFEPRQQELVTLNNRIETLAKEIQGLQAQANNAKPAVPIDLNAIQAQINSKQEE